MSKRIGPRILAAAALVLGLASTPIASQASTLAFDFTNLGSNNTQLGHSEMDNGVVASAYKNVTSSGLDDSLLWLRNQSSDHGLGVCDTRDESCATGGGDVNELSNDDDLEAIFLENQNGGVWTSLWVSSLDTGGTNGSEQGILYWADSESDLIDAVKTGVGGGAVANSVLFKTSDISGVEGDIFSLLPMSFDAAAPWLAFLPDFDNGDNNDYLVWKGTIEVGVPEPVSLALTGAGLLALGGFSRRTRTAE